jgi:hypothetical protein
LQGYLLPDPTRCAGDEHDFSLERLGGVQRLRVDGGINAAIILNVRMSVSTLGGNVLGVVGDGEVFVAAFVFVPVRHGEWVLAVGGKAGCVFDVS